MLESQTLTDLAMTSESLPQLESAQVVPVDQEQTLKFDLKVQIPTLLNRVSFQTTIVICLKHNRPQKTNSSSTLTFVGVKQQLKYDFWLYNQSTGIYLLPGQKLISRQIRYSHSWLFQLHTGELSCFTL